MKAPLMFSIPSLLCLCGVASAWCSLEGYDKGQPSAVRSEVNNGYAHFEWATDVDFISNRAWIWHYVLNKHKASGLGVKWPKAKIRHSVVAPIPPGRAACNRFVVNAVDKDIDTEAPIAYGTNEQEQDAAVYRASRAEKVTWNQLDTSFMNSAGEEESVHLSISSGDTGKSSFIKIQKTDNIIIGLSDLGRLLSKNQFEFVARSASSQDSAVTTIRDQRFVSAGFETPERLLESMYSGHEAKQLLDRGIIFFTGSAKGLSLEIPGSRLSSTAIDVIILDRTFRPIVATEISLLIPSQ